MRGWEGVKGEGKEGGRECGREGEGKEGVSEGGEEGGMGEGKEGGIEGACRERDFSCRVIILTWTVLSGPSSEGGDGLPGNQCQGRSQRD